MKARILTLFFGILITTTSFAQDMDGDGNPDTMDPNPTVPTVADDTNSTDPGVTVATNVLANDDYLPNNDVAVIGTTTLFDLGTGTATGVVVVDPITGEITYTPTAAESGMDVTIVYEVCSDDGVNAPVCMQATLTITVTGSDNDMDGVDDSVDLDDDNDGILDTDEVDSTLPVPSNDNDNDGIPNYADTDIGVDGNGDGVVDTYDNDGDGVPNHLDLDADNDGIYDVDETGGTDANNDGMADDTDGDSTNNNGIPSTAGTGNTPIDSDPANADRPDFLDTDSDGDGCNDADEAYGDATTDADDNGTYSVGTLTVSGGTVNIDGIVITAPYDTGAVTDVTTVGPDLDTDGIADVCDLDDDGDGNPDTMDPNPLVPTVADDTNTTSPTVAVATNVLTNDDYLQNNDANVLGTTTLVDFGIGTAAGVVIADALVGDITYTPTAAESGMDVTIVYEVCSDDGVNAPVCMTATLTITICEDSDCDGDGVTNDDEIADGTNINDPCSFVVGSITVAVTAITDCDGDGETNETDPDDSDPCFGGNLANVDLTDTTSNWYIADCDGDGVTNGNEVDPNIDGVEGPDNTDPNDPCDYNPVDVTLPQSGDWLIADCDGDGDPNMTDPEPIDPCNYTAGSVGDPTNPVWANADCDGDGETNLIDPDPLDPCVGGDLTNVDLTDTISDWYIADCDGDGVINGNEVDPDMDGFMGPDNTDPYNPCDYNEADITLPLSGGWYTADCDGDGVINEDEQNDGTDFFDPCDYNEASITVAQTSGWLTADCDVDGTLNSVDCDPLDNTITFGIGDTCDDGDPATLSDFYDANCNCIGLPNGDVDGDGVTNQQEVINNTDFNNPCDPIQNPGYTGYDADNTIWQNANCDDDYNNNALELILNTDPYDTNYNAIEGTVRYDSDNNGCDETDFGMPYKRLDITSDTETRIVYTDSLGIYRFTTFETGNYTITPNITENPSLFNITPTDASTSFSGFDNITIQDFCITANGVQNDLEIVVAPITPARPGFGAAYLITYRNKGNQIQSGDFSLTYNDNVLDFLTSTETPTSITTGVLTWNYVDLLPFESRSEYVTFNVNSPMDTPAVNIGDVLDFVVTINPIGTDILPEDNQFDYTQTVVGSFDPNNIICLEGDVAPPSDIGKYLHYIINFENTGTFFAENIVVTVEIDPNQFDIDSLVFLSSSHDAEISIENGNILQIVFQNIQLASGGHGNILLKTRSKGNLEIDDTVTKKASIFFDYNFPIETNLAETTFALLSNPNFTLDASISLYPNPVKNILSIKSKNTIKTLSLYDVQGRLLQTKTNNSSQVEFSMSNRESGIYFIKVMTNKGIITKKIVKN